MARDLGHLRARVLAAVAASPSLTRPQTRRRRAAALAGAGLVALAIFLAAGGAHPGGRPLALWLMTSVGGLAIAAAALRSARRSRSMQEPPARLLLAVAVATPLHLVLWKMAATWTFPGLATPEGSILRCLPLAAAMGLAPMIAFVATRRATSVLAGLGVGVVCGAFAWVLADLSCPDGGWRHLLLGHALALAFPAAVGLAGAARRGCA